MAKKLKLMSLFQELQGRAQVTNRRPAQTSTGVFLMQLRSVFGATTLPRRRFMISVDLSQPQSLPHPVKIVHVRNADAGSAGDSTSPVSVTVTVKRAAVPQVRSEPA
jgi:hypothetical protein